MGNPHNPDNPDNPVGKAAKEYIQTELVSVVKNFQYSDQAVNRMPPIAFEHMKAFWADPGNPLITLW